MRWVGGGGGGGFDRLDRRSDSPGSNPDPFKRQLSDFPTPFKTEL